MTSHNSAENMAHANQKHGVSSGNSLMQTDPEYKTSPYPSCANVESCGFADIAPVPKITSVQVTSPLPIGTQISGKGHRDAGSLVAVSVCSSLIVFCCVLECFVQMASSIQKHPEASGESSKPCQQKPLRSLGDQLCRIDP